MAESLWSQGLVLFYIICAECLEDENEIDIVKPLSIIKSRFLPYSCIGLRGMVACC